MTAKKPSPDPSGCSLEDVSRLVDYKLNELVAGSKPFPAAQYPWMPGFEPAAALRPPTSSGGVTSVSSLAAMSPLGLYPPPWPVTRLIIFLVELEMVPRKIDRVIAYLSAGQPNGPVLPPDPNRFPNLRRIKRLVEEARRLFDQGSFAEAKAKISEARTLAMTEGTREEIADVAVDDPLDPTSTNPTGRILADLLTELGFMWQFMSDLVPE